MIALEQFLVSPIGDRSLSRAGDRHAGHRTQWADAGPRPRRGGTNETAPRRRGGMSEPALRHRSAAAFLLLACATGCTPVPPDDPLGEASASAIHDGTDAAALEDTLMQRITEAYDFTNPDVVARMSALYPDSGRVISASGGFVTTTVDSLRQGLADFWANVGVNMSDPRWEWGDVHVDRLAGDAAVLTGTWSIPHIAPTGRPHTIHGAWTAVFRRLGGQWIIVQEHLSVPPETH